MQTVIIVIHLMIVLAMIAVILLQRSEGGGLGIGGGGGGGGMFSARGSANLLTRSTTVLAAVFFTTSLILGILAKEQANAPSILGTGAPAGAVAPGLPADDATRGTGSGILDALRQESGVPAPPADDGFAPAPALSPAAPAAPQVPTSE